MTAGKRPGCECCAGLSDRTPIEVSNRPGLAGVAYRSGTYSRFRASMLAGLSRASRPGLAALQTRDSDDFSIALIDAWAVATDVLTFYTERIANEHYLGTATERRSVAELAALIGYRLKPGVAAQTWLAFTLETAPGAPAESTIPARTRVQTLPGPGELPQTFETIEDLVAVAAWNRPQLRLTEPRTPCTGDTSVRLAGTAVTLRAGDQLLFVGADWTKSNAAARWQVVRVVTVTRDPTRQETVVAFSPSLTGLDLVPGVDVTVHVLRAQAALFGFNALNPLLLNTATFDRLAKNEEVNKATKEWKFDPAPNNKEIFLDGLYEGVEPGSWVVLTSDDQTELAAVDAVRETAMSKYAISARVSVLKLKRADLSGFGHQKTRSSLVAFRSEELPLADNPIPAPLSGSAVPLAQQLPATAEPQRILVRGKRPRAGIGTGAFVEDVPWSKGDTTIVLSADEEIELPCKIRWTLRPEGGADFTATGDPDALVYLPALASDDTVGEVVMAAGGPDPEPLDAITLTEPLVNVYDRQGAAPIDIYGNVADATHGETVSNEVLGSGDGAHPFQQFTLRKTPLTHVPAPTASGGQPTLEVRVNGIAWREAATLFGAGRRDRVYVSAIGDDGTTTLTFGDGETGARLPTGQDNVVATYRAGLGLAGMARTDQITLALARPLGLKAVTNPLPAGGAQDGQTIQDARTNAPRTVLTLGRVVSLQDYADFAAGYSGIGKATATWTWDGARRGVLVTVAAADGSPLPAGSPLLDNLRSSLLAAGNLRVPVELRDFQPVQFTLRAALRVTADYDPDVVREAATAALVARYSFANRTFGQGVSLSEVTQTVHAVAGVDALRVDRLHRADEPPHVATFLVAAAPRPGEPPGGPGAEILMLAADSVVLEVGW